jgi:hypothetical protein
MLDPNPKPKILNPAPRTMNRNPFTLYPEPFLNPNLVTLNATPLGVRVGLAPLGPGGVYYFLYP